MNRAVVREHGFTLIELMVTLVVAGILLALGIPSLTRLISNNRIAQQTNEFVNALNLARSEAVKRSQGVAIRSTSAGLGIEFATGWQVFNDPNADGALASAADVIRESGGLSGKTTLRRVTCVGSVCTDADASMTDRQYIVFTARGGNGAGTAAWFRACDAGNTSLPGRIVQVSSVGRVSLSSSTATCP